MTKLLVFFRRLYKLIKRESYPINQIRVKTQVEIRRKTRRRGWWARHFVTTQGQMWSFGGCGASRTSCMELGRQSLLSFPSASICGHCSVLASHVVPLLILFPVPCSTSFPSLSFPGLVPSSSQEPKGGRKYQSAVALEPPNYKFPSVFLVFN